MPSQLPAGKSRKGMNNPRRYSHEWRINVIVAVVCVWGRK